MPVRPILVLASLALLAACGKKEPENDARSAKGEVLQGTISDAMLPLDTVRSQPPLAEPEAAAKVSAGATDGATDEATDAPAEDETPAADEPTPAAEEN